MRLVSLKDFQSLVYSDDSKPPSFYTLKERCRQGLIPGAIRDGGTGPWKVDMDTYSEIMQERIRQVSSMDQEDADFVNQLQQQLHG